MVHSAQLKAFFDIMCRRLSYSYFSYVDYLFRQAGITTTLNTRCSVLAAANSVYGRWDDTKGDDNIDFMPTILSRFDMIYIVKDEHDFHKDTTLAKHVISVHMNAVQAVQEVEGEISLAFLKKYIAYCRS